MARCTSVGVTAQTSHRSCVMTSVGSSVRRSASSRRYRPRRSATEARTCASISRLGLSVSMTLRTTTGFVPILGG